MEIITRDYTRVNVIRIVGRIDASTAPQFEDTLNDYIHSSRYFLVLEMDGTDFLSSAGVRALISAQKSVKPRGGKIAIAQPSQRVTDVLDLAGLRPLFPIYDTTEAAVGDL
jgi:anti-sigma B factor antagonist